MSIAARRVRMAKRTTTATFNPLTQVTPLHAVWAGDPSWSHPADGGAVTSWRNQSGGGDPAQATGGAQPLYRATASSMGSKPAVEFDGTDDYLRVTETVAQPFKLLVVGRWTTLPGGSTQMMVGSGSASRLFGIDTTNKPRVNLGSTLVAASVTNTAGHVFRSTLNGASSEFWIDGTSVATGTVGTNGLTDWRLGAGGGGTVAQFAPVQIGFCGLYDGATSDTDLAQLASDLKTHYSL